MSRPVRPSLIVPALLAALFTTLPHVASADDEEEVVKPAILVTLAGVDRAFSDMDYVLGLGERAELGDQVRGLLGFVNDLKGIDREKPMGFALYLKPGLIPTPVPVGFVPVDGIEDLMETIELGPVVTRKVTGSANQYEIVGPNRSIFVEVRDGYALIANDTLTFEDNLENPAKMGASFAKKYDASIALYVENVPKTTREFFLSLLQTSANAELQQRDDEPDAVYALRKANGKRTFESIEMLLRDVRNFTIGWDTSIEHKRAVLDFEVELAPDTELAKLMEETLGKRSLFGPVVDEKSPLSLAASWMINELDRDILVELFNVGSIELAKVLNPDAEPAVDTETGRTTPVEDPLATKLMEPLIATAKAGHMDLFFQFQAEDTEHMVLVGGARVLNADDFGAALVPIIQRITERPEIEVELTTSVDTHRGVAIHRLHGPSGDGEARLYGEPPSLYLAAGHRAIWFAVGGENAPATLKATLDGVLDATVEEKTKVASPFRMVLNAKGWMQLQPDPNAPPQIREFAEKAFSPGGDSIRIDFQPTENGGRTRVTIEEGFLRLMGYGIGAAADAGEAARERRRQNRGDRPERPAA